MSAGTWLKKAFDAVLDRALTPLITTVLSAAVIVGLRDKLHLPVPLWAGVVALALGGVLGYGVSHWRTRRRPTHPTDTLRIFPRRSDWSFGYTDQRAYRANTPTSVGLHFHFEVTNITNVPVRLIEAQLSVGRLQGRVNGWVLTRETEGRLYSSQHYIEPGHTTEASADFQITPPPRATKRGRALVATVLFRDQWGNKCTVRKVGFKPPRPQPAEVGEPVGERLHTIVDPIEKAIASILKAEIQRYRDAGSRSHGHLGSIKSSQRGKEVAGIGADWRQVDSTDNQSLVFTDDLPVIMSDNLDSLVALYGRLPTNEDRKRYIDALLRRADRESEYAEVGYLIALASFRVGQLDRFLPVAKERLQGDNAFGFGEVLRILDALLRFEHPAFSSQQLDAIEQFTEGLPTSETSRIRERVFAIRAHRAKAGD